MFTRVTKRKSSALPCASDFAEHLFQSAFGNSLSRSSRGNEAQIPSEATELEHSEALEEQSGKEGQPLSSFAMPTSAPSISSPSESAGSDCRHRHIDEWLRPASDRGE